MLGLGKGAGKYLGQQLWFKCSLWLNVELVGPRPMTGVTNMWLQNIISELGCVTGTGS